MENFKNLYNKEVKNKLQQEFNYQNSMLLPKISKVTLNMGVGDAVRDSKKINHAVEDMKAIACQRPVITKARKSNAAFKLREGMPIGVKVTLRRDNMFSFLEKLILVALPRSRDFKGFSVRNFDGRGNLSFGIKEQIVFPEIEYDKIDTVRGLDITVVTTAKTDEEAKSLLSGFYFPFIN